MQLAQASYRQLYIFNLAEYVTTVPKLNFLNALTRTVYSFAEVTSRMCKQYSGFDESIYINARNNKWLRGKLTIVWSISLIANLINAEFSDPSAASLSQNANNANLTGTPWRDAF